MSPPGSLATIARKYALPQRAELNRRDAEAPRGKRAQLNEERLIRYEFCGSSFIVHHSSFSSLCVSAPLRFSHRNVPE
jgi:hypothetical protein